MSNEEAGAQQQPGLIRNRVSFVGIGLAMIAAANIVFLVFIDVMSPRPNPYIGIFGYMVMPGVMGAGLLLIPIGMLLERRKRRLQRPSEIAPFPKLDLNDPKQRRTIAAVACFLIVFAALSAAGSYRAYEYTDSVQFCGQLCHTVMNPEYTAYLQSPHARVRCVDCHVGEGASWYVRSKLSGAYQVYSVTFHKYPKPIPTPVANLRPAPETCEQCHWPQKFHGAQLKIFTHYSSDEKNTPRQVQLLIKTGGGDPATGAPSGIHWHMNIANKISYLASDAQRQVIPWVQVEDLNGKVTVYQSKDAQLAPDVVAKTAKRRMDCIDCHNRPTHIYMPPDRSVDDSMQAGRLDTTLPFIKQQAVTVLTNSYTTTPEATQAIARDLTAFYQTKYPDIAQSKAPQIKSAVAELQAIYARSIFPEMKVDWRVHPSNIGHMYSSGCFRCHDGNHVSADGKVIKKDCTICHDVNGQSEAGQSMADIRHQQFKHPVDIGDLSAVNCSDCHNGGVGP